MAIQTEQKEAPISEEKAREREALKNLLNETSPSDTYGLIEQIFNNFKNLQELPERVEKLKLFPVSYLSLNISPDRLKSTQKAITYLYPMVDQHISRLQSSPFPVLLPTFAFVSALFRYWAVLSSDKLKKVIHALARLDISEIIQEQGFGIATPQHAEYRAASEISSCLRILKATKYDVRRLFDNEIVSIPSPDELELIAKNRRPIPPIAAIGETRDNSIRRNQDDYHLVLCIDPYNEVSDILDKVRAIIEAHHNKMKKVFDQNKEVPRGIGYFNPLRHPFNAFERMDFSLPYDNKELFNEIDPLQYFQLKEKGGKGRDAQKVTDDNFHALITFELRKCDIRPVDIERRFFGLVAAPKTNTYRAKTKAHNDRYKRAVRLIDRALACAPIQS